MKEKVNTEEVKKAAREVLHAKEDEAQTPHL